MQRRTLLLALGSIAASPAKALYDPKPIALLDRAPGRWVGSLTYRDYQKPDKMVTLKTAMIVSLAAPNELILYYVFDDGPGKTVYSYERMSFDLAANRLIWDSGTSKPDHSEYKITATEVLEAKSSLVFEKKSETRNDKCFLEITTSNWSLVKYEISAEGTENLRSKYEFERT